MRTRVTAAGLVSVTVALALGCSSGTGGGTLPLADLEQAALQAVCHYEALCGQYPDAATCLANVQESPHFYPSLSQLIAQGRVTYDGAAAKRCFDKLNGLSTCARSVVNAPGALDACNFLTGNVAQGGACLFSEECRNGGTCIGQPACDSFAQCCPGACSAGETPVALGGDCSQGPSACVRGTTCVSSADFTSATCQTPITTVGGSCASIPCAGTLYCDPTTHTCRALSPEGGACDPRLSDLDCDDPRDRCDATGHCTPRLPVGAACTDGDTCAHWVSCDGITATCVPRPMVGESCISTTTTLDCLGGRCDSTSGTCVLLPVGDSCL